MKTGKYILTIWVIVMFLVSFTSSLGYIVAQQSLRLGANEAAIQLAIETSMKLQDGMSAKEAVPVYKEDISKSLSPFVMIYDKNQRLLATSAEMDGGDPLYPLGVLSYVDQKGEDRVTWQPQAGLRFASVAIKYQEGYIVAARSLQEPEKLIDDIGRLVVAAWLACAIFSALAAGVIFFLMKKIFTVK